MASVSVSRAPVLLAILCALGFVPPVTAQGRDVIRAEEPGASPDSIAAYTDPTHSWWGREIDKWMVSARAYWASPPASVMATRATDPDDGTWEEIPPPTRAGHGMIYDPIRDRVLVFGGAEGPGNDLWEIPLRGSREWKLLTTKGALPPPNSGQPLVYDSRRDRLIALTGSGGSEGIQAWALDLGGELEWTLLAPRGEGPSMRNGESAVYDPVRDRIVVCGGQYWPDYFDEVWELNLQGRLRWKLLPAPGPSPGGREGSAAIYDPVRQRMLMFGGFGTHGAYHFGDLWAFKLDGPFKWERISKSGTGPVAREYATAVYDSRRDRMIVFGGHAYRGDDAWAFDLASSTWHQLGAGASAPDGRQMHGAIYDPVEDRMLIHGGVGSFAFLRDMWSLSLGDGEIWRPFSPADAGPSELKQTAAVFDPIADRMLVFGGWAEPYCDKTWALSLGSGAEWIPLDPAGSVPAARDVHKAIFDSERNQMVIFGGYDQYRTFGDVSVLDLSGTQRWSTMAVHGPGPAAGGHSAVFDSRRKAMIVYGGQTNGAFSVGSRLWALPLRGTATWTSITSLTTGPGPRAWHTAVFDSKRSQMVLFGGWDGQSMRNDVWLLDPSTWQWWSPAPQGAQPPARDLAEGIYDPIGDRMVIFGGNGPEGPSDEVWALSLGVEPEWRRLRPAGFGPAGRSEHVAVYDSNHDRMILFGGWSFGGLWTLSWNRRAATAAHGGFGGSQGTIASQTDLAREPHGFGLSILSSNPATRALDVEFSVSAGAAARLEMVDVSGRKLRSQEVTAMHGVQRVEFGDLDRLPAGIYFIRLSQGMRDATARFCIVH